MKIAVGLSGGVDSSVTAALLKKAGHEVVGITMKLWSDGKYTGGSKDACFGPNEQEDIAVASALCDQLNIPYHVFDCSKEYEEIVLDYFRNEYLSGNTPNPCVFCNSLMKFGVLPSLAQKSGINFDKFATGHYARIEYKENCFRLLKGKDISKDQSYFLYRLTQKQLSNLYFPLGEFTKKEVRAFAQEFNIAVKDKPDSQDFYSGDYTELLNTPDKEGHIINTRGEILGIHNGFWHYTIGQRKGLGIAATKPLYVLALNPCKNQVVVGFDDEVFCREVDVVNCNWISNTPHEGKLEVKVRSASEPIKATLNKNSLIFSEPIKSIAKGQSAVFYLADELIGGGIINNVKDKL